MTKGISKPEYKHDIPSDHDEPNDAAQDDAANVLKGEPQEVRIAALNRRAAAVMKTKAKRKKKR
ncbi:MAG: hypothetical protein HRF49_08350 [bacterium]|jgi:hypothetical protein